MRSIISIDIKVGTSEQFGTAQRWAFPNSKTSPGGGATHIGDKGVADNVPQSIDVVGSIHDHHSICSGDEFIRVGDSAEVQSKIDSAEDVIDNGRRREQEVDRFLVIDNPETDEEDDRVGAWQRVKRRKGQRTRFLEDSL